MTGAICGLIGVYIVLRNMSYIGHGLSHSVFGGAVVSYVMNWNFYLGAGLWGFLSALLINAVAKRKKIGADAVIGIVTTASFAVGVVLISRVRKFTRNFEAALFGNILGVTGDDLIVIGGVSFLSALVILVLYKQLLFTTFDPEVARVYGVPVEWVDTAFALVLAATIVVSMQVLGVMLIVAAIVIPAATARLLTHSFHRLVFSSVAIGILCGVGGMYLSFSSNASSGATIVLFAAAIFAAALGYDSLRRLAARPLMSAAAIPAQHEHSHLHGDILHQHEHPTKLDVEHSHHISDDTPVSAGASVPGASVGSNGARQFRLTVEGMTCVYCARAVERAIGRVEGVTSVHVDLPARSVDVTMRGPSGGADRVRNAIRTAGYQPRDDRLFS
jgi:manganese/iron transport system permease protein/iron/zinc/copper transport system permease protein